jgi:large subunit ribosomal protein L21
MEKAGARNTMYAVILTGGKQLRVEEGSVVRVEKLTAEVGDTVTFKEVAAIGDESGLAVGAPFVDGASVTAKVLANGKGKKIRVFTYKPKCGQKRAMGHRQPFTQIRIESISK